jgi:hypothetical protein
MNAALTELSLPVPLVYIETTIPAGMTIAEYRAWRPRPARRRGLSRLWTGKRS